MASIEETLIRQLITRMTRLEHDIKALRTLLGDEGSFYETVDTVHYKRALLNRAREFQATGGRISRDEVDRLWTFALEDGKLSPLERRTLQYINGKFNLTDVARNHLLQRLSM